MNSPLKLKLNQIAIWHSIYCWIWLWLIKIYNLYFYFIIEDEDIDDFDNDVSVQNYIIMLLTILSIHSIMLTSSLLDYFIAMGHNSDKTW